jgi:hypothetical protein
MYLVLGSNRFDAGDGRQEAIPVEEKQGRN